MSKNKIFLIDRLLAIPLAVYFWWHGLKHKRQDRAQSLVNTAANDSAESK